MSESKGKKRTFNSAEKHNLAEEVKKRKCLWDTSDQGHSQHFVVKSAWQEIATAMNKTVVECKSAWSSLRDSRRYHLNVAQKKKSGDAGDWEFAEVLSFLPNLKQKRTRTFTKVYLNEGDATVHMKEESACGSSSSGLSNYRYSEPASPKSPMSPAKKLEKTLTKYLESQMDTQQIERMDLKLVHFDKYLYLDNMLKKLPVNVAEELLFETICKVRAEVKKYD